MSNINLDVISIAFFKISQVYLCLTVTLNTVIKATKTKTHVFLRYSSSLPEEFKFIYMLYL